MRPTPSDEQKMAQAATPQPSPSERSVSALRCFWLAVPAALLLAGAQASAQAAYPRKSIRLVVPFAAGGGGDVLARVLSEKLKARLNQPVVVDNRPGASGIIGSDIVAEAPADGYTLLLNTPNLVMTKFMTPRLPFDPLADLVPVAELVRAQLWLAVSTSRTDARTVQEFVDQAKAKGEGLFYGSVGRGTVGHLLGYGFAHASGIKAEHVAYKGGAPATLALLIVEISFAVMDYVVLKPQVVAGKARLLATIGPKRSAHSLATPAVIQRLADESKAVVADPEVIAKFSAVGYDPGTLVLDEFSALVKTDHDRWNAIIRKAGVKMD